jgi:hypothetical protein
MLYWDSTWLTEHCKDEQHLIQGLLIVKRQDKVARGCDGPAVSERYMWRCDRDHWIDM